MSLDQLSLAVLAALAAHPQPVSSIKLAKQLGVQQSSLLRCLALLALSSSQTSQHIAGLGWVEVTEQDERKLLSLTPLGRQVWDEFCEAQ